MLTSLTQDREVKAKTVIALEVIVVHAAHNLKSISFPKLLKPMYSTLSNFRAIKSQH